MGLLLRCVAKLRLEHVARCVGPETHSSIARASGDELLLNAHVQTVNLLRVEGGDQVLVLLALVRSTQVNHDFDQLARTGREYDCVLVWRQSQSCDLVNVDVLVHHLTSRVVVAHRRWNQIISRVNAHIRLLWIDFALDEHSESAAVTSNDESALTGSACLALGCGRSTRVLRRDATEGRD